MRWWIWIVVGMGLGVGVIGWCCCIIAKAADASVACIDNDPDETAELPRERRRSSHVQNPWKD